jgi:hypothetical protein
MSPPSRSWRRRSASCQRCRVAAAGREQLESAVWPVLVVVAPADAEHVLEMAAAEDEDAVEALGANGADPAFGEGIRVRRLDRRADHSDPFRPEDLIERAAESRVAIMDEEAQRLLTLELHGEVARLLGDPASVRVRTAGEVLDPPGRERDEEQDIDPLQEDCLDGEEVARRACSPPALARRWSTTNVLVVAPAGDQPRATPCAPRFPKPRSRGP